MARALLTWFLYGLIVWCLIELAWDRDPKMAAAAFIGMAAAWVVADDKQGGRHDDS